jgi:anaerobic selenocysteine-containing dehydrogenase
VKSLCRRIETARVCAVPSGEDGFRSSRFLIGSPIYLGGFTKVVRTMCPMNCHPTFCGMLVEVEDGKLKSVSGDNDNPDSQGFLCVRRRSTNEIFGNPRRLLYPQIRDDRRTNT